MGTVWRAEDELLARQVAVKKLRVPPQLHDDERERLYERTRREARSAARITHPNVVVVHDVVEDEGLPCVVMEYVPSRTLADVLKNDGPISPREAARIGRGMVAALRAAHRAGVLHRDVKPANVLLGLDGAESDEGWPGGRVVLTDFGIAMVTGTSTLTRTGELIGSFDYLAPERITGGTPGPASDLWALGATLYQAVEGVAPFHRDTPIETAYAIASEPVATPRNAGPLAPLIQSLLAKEPERRMTAEQVEKLLVSSVETVVAHGSRTGSQEPRPWPAPDSAGQDTSGGAAGADDGTTGTTGTTGADGTASRRDHEPDTAHVPPQEPADPAITAATMVSRQQPSLPYEPQGEAEPHGEHPAEQAVPRRRRGKRVAGALVALVVIAAGGLLLSHRLMGAAGGSTGGQSSAGGGSGGPSPSTSTSPPPQPTWPPGYHLVDDPRGFSMAVPDGWTRESKPNGDVDFVDDATKTDLKVSIEDYAGPSPLQHWLDLQKVLKGDDNGYSLLRMNATTADVGGITEPAAIWEWKWTGQLREYHAIDLGFGKEGGTEYALYLSAPDDEWQQELPVFKVATGTFRP
jgi:eukaryotic-like serine/threonine-protein kinase